MLVFCVDSDLFKCLCRVLFAFVELVISCYFDVFWLFWVFMVVGCNCGRSYLIISCIRLHLWLLFCYFGLSCLFAFAGLLCLWLLLSRFWIFILLLLVVKDAVILGCLAW